MNIYGVWWTCRRIELRVLKSLVKQYYRRILDVIFIAMPRTPDGKGFGYLPGHAPP